MAHTGGSFTHIPAPKFCSQAPTCVETVVYFFPFNGCLGSRGAFGFVFVLVLSLSFTHAMYGLFFFVNFRLFSESFSLSASNFPSPYFQFVQEYGISIGNRTEWSIIQRVIGRVISNLKLRARLSQNCTTRSPVTN